MEEPGNQVNSTTFADFLTVAYKKESCNSNPGWCFKKVVGTCLPSSFNVRSKSKRADTTSDMVWIRSWQEKDMCLKSMECIIYKYDVDQQLGQCLALDEDS